jgi:hypothetical protein
MFGKITGALIRREADAYRSQGLHEEALALIKKNLNSTLQLPADVRESFEQQIRQIEAEMADSAADENETLSGEQMAVIRQGWSEDASLEDLAVSAHALHAMGCYGNALEEFGLLIQRGYSAHRIIGAMAQCLVKLNSPPKLVDAVDCLAAELFPDARNNFAFKLSLAEEMVKARFAYHSMELSRHLSSCTGISSSYRVRLEALAKDLKSVSRRKLLTPARKKDTPPEAGPASPSGVRRIWAAVKAIPARLRLPKSGR